MVTGMATEPNEAEVRKYREKHFAVKVEPLTPEPFSEAELALRVTHNGSQWNTLGLTRAEAARVVAELVEFLAGSVGGNPAKPKLGTRELLRHHCQKAGEFEVRMFEKYAGLLADYSESEIIRMLKIPVNSKGKRSLLRLAVKLHAKD